MTDDLKQREAAVAAAAASSEEPTISEVDESANLEAQENKAEAYLKENKGFLQSLFSKIPGPIRLMVRSVLKILLLPLRLLAILPFRGIYTFLNDFVNKG